MSRSMAKAIDGTWLYCVVASKTPPPMARALEGPPGTGRPRLLELGEGLWIVVSDAPLSRYGTSALEEGLRDEAWVSACALAHESVIEHFMKRAPVLPMKLFTLFEGDVRARSEVGRDRAKLHRLFARVRGCAEWSVRVRLDEERATRVARTRSARGTGRLGAGTAFLAKKKRAKDEVGRLVRRARGEAERAYDALARQSRRARRRPAPIGTIGARLLLDAVFLVPDARAKGFVRAAQRIEKALAKDGCSVTASGPWPPYHFVGA